jgi:hypothetical protein
MNISFDLLGDIITAKELSIFLKFGYAKTLGIIKYGGLKHFLIGNSYRVYKKDLIEFLENNQGYINTEDAR